MKMKKQALAATLAAGLALSGTMSVYAAAADAVTKETGVSEGQGVPSVITGTIAITNIKVKVPITSAFDIDPNEALELGKASPQIKADGQAANYTITNMSTVPIDVSITKLDLALGKDGNNNTLTGTDPAIVKTISELETTDRALMFSIRPSSTDAQKAAAPLLPADKNTAIGAEWLQPNASGVIDNTYKFTDAATNGNICTLEGVNDTNTDEVNMTLYGATKKGWNAKDSFTVTPTFTIGLHVGS